MTITRPVPSNPPTFMSVPEFARYAGLGRSSIYEIFARNEIATVKIGRRRLVPIENAKAWRAAIIAKAQPNGGAAGGIQS